MNNDRITEVFARVGREFGYETRSVVTARFKRLKIQWKRSAKWIEFKVTFHLKDAPDVVLEAIARMTFERILGKPVTGYPPEVIEWATKHMEGQE